MTRVKFEFDYRGKNRKVIILDKESKGKMKAEEENAKRFSRK